MRVETRANFASIYSVTLLKACCKLLANLRPFRPLAYLGVGPQAQGETRRPSSDDDTFLLLNDPVDQLKLIRDEINAMRLNRPFGYTQ